MISDRDFTRRMVETVATITGVAILLAVLWAARDALLIVYISALIAMGLSPLVKMIERPRRHGATRRVPRWLAILAIYAVLVAVVIFIGLLVIPPLVSQGASLWANLPTEFNRFQLFLIRHKLMSHRVTLEEAVQNAPSALNVPLAIRLFEYFKGRSQTAFGIGTNLTNDLGYEPLQIVIKMTRCNGQPVAKISDEPSKAMDYDPSYVAYLREVFQVPKHVTEAQTEGIDSE